MKKIIEKYGVEIGLVLFITLAILMFSLTKTQAQNNWSYTSPDLFGAIHQNKTFAQAGKDQAYINSNYPGFGFTTATMVDAAAWNKAVKQSISTGKMIIAHGTYWVNNDSIVFPKAFKKLKITGNWSLNVTGTNNSPVFTRPRPTDNSDANVMIGAYVDIDGGYIGSYGIPVNRIGIDLGPTYNSEYRHIVTEQLSEAIHLRFALNSGVAWCEALSCISGWTADMGNWPGAGTANSQSNVTSFDHCRFYADDNSNYAFGIYACSGVVLSNNIIEGFKVRAGIDFDALGATVVKSFNVYNTHFECVNGATEGAIKLRLSGGMAVIDGIFGQYASVMINAFNYGGASSVHLLHSVYWVPDPVKKYFVNSNCSWLFEENANIVITPNEYSQKFSGTPVQQLPGNQYQLQNNWYWCVITM